MSILELAKQGDAKAIATLINRSLRVKGVSALVRSRQNRLDIVLQAAVVPHQSEFAALIIKGIQNLELSDITSLNLYGRRLGQDTAAWRQNVAIATNNSAPKSQANSLVAVSVNMNQLSASQPSSSEYQDVIVRFSDRQGRLKCLTSLKELVQVISRASFSYPAIALQPSLKNLLDTLGEFSKTDRSGRQLITNVSILRPGQNWQKVSIRINNQLIFEPDDQSPAITVDGMEYLSPQAEAFAKPSGSLLDEFGEAAEGNSKKPKTELESSSDLLFGAVEPLSPARFSRPINQSAGSLLDEFGAAIATDPVILIDSISLNPKSIPNPDSGKATPYNPNSGSFLAEFTAALDAVEPSPPSPIIPIPTRIAIAAIADSEAETIQDFMVPDSIQTGNFLDEFSAALDIEVPELISAKIISTKIISQKPIVQTPPEISPEFQQLIALSTQPNILPVVAAQVSIDTTIEPPAAEMEDFFGDFGESKNEAKFALPTKPPLLEPIAELPPEALPLISPDPFLDLFDAAVTVAEQSPINPHDEFDLALAITQAEPAQPNPIPYNIDDLLAELANYSPTRVDKITGQPSK